MKRLRLGELLVQIGATTPEQVIQALKKQKQEGGRVGDILLSMGAVTTAQMAQALSEQSGLDLIDLKAFKITPELLESIPRDLAEQKRLMPVERTNGLLRVALADPYDVAVLDDLRFRLNLDIEPVVADAEEIGRAIMVNYGVSATDETLEELGLTDEVEYKELGEGSPEEGAAEGEDAPVIRLVTSVIGEAVKMRASDIHIEPFERRIRIRYRVDGVCIEIDKIKPPKRLQGSIISRIKIMARMQIEEKRKPQDGQIKITLMGRAIDLRVSILPSTWGESVVMRILEKDALLLGIDNLGFEADDHAKFMTAVKRPNGINLVTGPTGSGKTTSLYAALNDLNRPDVKIITAEDPVEYHMSGINQAQVNHQIGFSFARILRAMLRQAPNIILVGEIRDKETAEAAIEAALTGHLVFSTLHTNDAPSAITRLIDMGIKPFLVASSLQSVMGQRLVRLICKDCRETYPPKPHEVRALGFKAGEEPEDLVLYRGKGCATCHGQGYKGRKGIFELMMMNRAIRELAFHQAPATELRRAARAAGMKVLREDGIRKVLKGITTLEEVDRETASEMDSEMAKA